jgi:hypothetical protein
MEIFGNPFSGYGTLYYQTIIEQLANINESYLNEKLPEQHKNGSYTSNCNSPRCLNYKTRDKGNKNCCSQISQEGLEIRLKNKEAKLKLVPKTYRIKKVLIPKWTYWNKNIGNSKIGMNI